MIKNICAGLLILCQSTFDFQKDFEYNNNEEFIKGNETNTYTCICKLVPNVDPKKVKVY